jgi:hypothetical protein
MASWSRPSASHRKAIGLVKSARRRGYPDGRLAPCYVGQLSGRDQAITTAGRTREEPTRQGRLLIRIAVDCAVGNRNCLTSGLKASTCSRARA